MANEVSGSKYNRDDKVLIAKRPPTALLINIINMFILFIKSPYK